MTNTKTVRETLRAMAAVAAFVPALALAVLVNPTQLPVHPARFSAQAVTGGVPQEEMVTRLIVKPRYRIGDPLKIALNSRDASGVAKVAGVPMSVLRPMSGGAHVLHFDKPVTLSEARVIAARLMRDSSVELAAPDRKRYPTSLTTTDPGYSSQWNLFAPSPSDLGGVDLPSAWGVTKGSAAITVAVIDTGYRPHTDLVNALLPNYSLGYGYDFIADIPTANDGDGRDADARDPGDWITGAENTNSRGAFYKCGYLDNSGNPLNQLTPSSWHGTHVTGIIAATAASVNGLTGIAPNIKILPVRVLGKCGGYDSDIVDAMRWAAGIAVSGVPTNPYPAKVINMSLGAVSATCSPLYQQALTDVINAGAVVAMPTGNDSSATTLNEPANCAATLNNLGIYGAIAVTAHAINGDNAWYANIGAGTTISAPGGDCGGTSYNPSTGVCSTAGPSVYSLGNTGTTVPANNAFVDYAGTSMATPHVAGVAALMLSAYPALTPVQVISALTSSARAFPANTTCTSGTNVGMCGAGMLDAYQALQQALNGLPVVTLNGIPSVVAPAAQITLSGSAVAGTGRNIASYAWTQPSGPTTVFTNSPGANISFSAPSTSGTYSFRLTATDDLGQTNWATAVVIVNSPPVLGAVANQTVVAGQPLNFTVTATDPDGDSPIIFNSVSLCPATSPGCSTSLLSHGASLNATTGIFNWPGAAPAGNYILTYYASDNYANSANGTVNIIVTAAPAPAPAAAAGGGGGGGGGALDGAVLAAAALLAFALRLRRRQLKAASNTQK